jgi:hypothetical protein
MKNTRIFPNALAARRASVTCRHVPSCEVLDAIREVNRAVLHDDPYRPQSRAILSATGPPPLQATEGLSPREQEVLDCLSKGFLYKKSQTVVQLQTVHTYIAAFMKNSRSGHEPRRSLNSEAIAYYCSDRSLHDGCKSARTPSLPKWIDRSNPICFRLYSRHPFLFWRRTDAQPQISHLPSIFLRQPTMVVPR